MQAKKVMAPAMYAAIMIGAHLATPPNPDTLSAPMDLIMGFRIVSAFTMSVFWALLGIILGAFWDKLRPHETAKISV
jgi:predicted cobalt transporter CbtA